VESRHADANGTAKRDSACNECDWEDVDWPPASVEAAWYRNTASDHRRSVAIRHARYMSDSAAVFFELPRSTLSETWHTRAVRRALRTSLERSCNVHHDWIKPSGAVDN